VANYGCQKIISMPRSVPKIAIFEEAARTLGIPGGTKMIQQYYRQMREFGCNILAVIQQYDIIKDSAVRGAMIGNSKLLLKLEILAGGAGVGFAFFAAASARQFLNCSNLSR
jgi:type IV secretion system protein TrbE